MSVRCFIRDSSLILIFNFSRLLLFSCQVFYAFPFPYHTQIIFFIIFNPRIIVLQYCIGFFHTTAWSSRKYIYVSLLNLPLPPPASPTLQAVTENRVELPVWHSHFPLAICFTYRTVHVSVLLSQFVLSAPSPAVSRVCFLPCKEVHQYWFFLDSIHMH